MDNFYRSTWVKSVGCLMALFSILSFTQLNGQILVSTAASCDGAAMGEYFVTFSGATGGVEPYNVVDPSDGVTIVQWMTGDAPLVFGPFPHSGAGGSGQEVMVYDSKLYIADSMNMFTPEVLCAVDPMGGQASGMYCDTTTSPDDPVGDLLVQSVPGTFKAGGSTGQIQKYLLVDSVTGDIIDMNMTGFFEDVADFEYKVYAVNYRVEEAATIEPFLEIGENIEPLDQLAIMPPQGPLAGACMAVCPVPGTFTCYSVGSTVWIDSDDDGVLDPGEMGIAGIELILFNAAGDTVAVTMTDADGNYYFGGLPAGDYYIEIPMPDADYPDVSTPPAGTDDGTDDNNDGTQSMSGGTVTSFTFTLGDGEPTDEDGQGGDQDMNNDGNGDMTIDFGFREIICPEVEILPLGNPEVTCCDSLLFQVSVDPDTNGMWTLDPAAAGTLDTTMGMDGDLVQFTPAMGFGGEVLLIFTPNVEDASCLPEAIDTFTFWVIADTTGPEFLNCPPDTFSVALGICSDSVSLEWPIPVATDDCRLDSTVQTMGPEYGATQAEGTYEICYTAYDKSANETECCFVVEVESGGGPLPAILACQKDMEMAADDMCVFSSEEGMLDPVIAENPCDPFELAHEIAFADGTMAADSGTVPAMTAFPLGENEICYFVNDTMGNVLDSCCFLLTVVDETAPEIMCAAGSPFTFSADAGACEYTHSGTGQDATAMDNCPALAALFHDQMAADSSTLDGVVFPIGETTVVWTAVDSAGNESTCEIVIIVEDTESPTLDCQAIMMSEMEADAGECSFTMPGAGFDPSYADNCPDSSITHDYALAPSSNTLAGATFPVGETTVVWTVTDAAGNTATCEITITITDTLAPAFVNCPTDTIWVNTDVDLCGSDVNWSIPVADDACGVDSVVQTEGPAPGSTLDTGITVIQYVAYDPSGNTDTCEFVISVNDSDLPTVTCPQDITVSASDMCNWVSPDGSLTPVTAENCDSVLTYEVTGATTAMGMDDASGTTFELGVSTVTYFLMETGGNMVTDSCSFTVTVVDDEAPMITCPMDMTVECDGLGNTQALEAWIASVTGTDNCTDEADLVDTAIVINTISGCGSTNTEVYEFSITDEAGNTTTCLASFTIEDTTPPMLTCCPDFELALGADGTASIDVSDIVCGATDNCSDSSAMSYSIDMSMFDQSNVGDNVVTLTVVDECGNESTCTTTVTVTQMPSLGVAKRAVSVVAMPDGSFDVTYEINVENLGNVDIADVQVTDDLAAAFPAPCVPTVTSLTSETLTVNTGYDGTGTTEMLDGADDLEIGERAGILLTVNVSDCVDAGPYGNSATATGTAPGDSMLTDDSDDGSDPDPDGDGPDNDSDTTFVTLDNTAGFGIAKRAVSVLAMADGSFDVTYEINVENFGSVDLDSIQVVDDLAAAFPAPCAPTVTTLTSDDFTVNTAYDGVGDTDLLDGGDDLPAGDQGAILLTVNVADCVDPGPYGNSATGTANAPGDSTLTDDSDDGSDPDGDGDGDPTNDGDTTFVTLSNDVSFGVAKRAVNVKANADGSFDVTYEINVENDGAVDLDSIQVVDDLAAAFPAPCNPVVMTLTSDDFTVNTAYDGIGDTEMLTGNDDLPAGDLGAILLTINVTDCVDSGPFGNSATGTAYSPGDSTLTDDSDDGSDPDGDGDGDPTNDGDTTFVTLDNTASFGVAKRAVNVKANADGSFDVTYEINVENDGAVDLDSIQVVDDLAAAFPAPCNPVVMTLTSDDFTVNTAYDGVADTDLLTGGDDLPAGDLGAILLTVNVSDCVDSGPFGNSATGTANAPGDSTLTDDSDDGSDPDGDGDGDPTNDSDTTFVTLDNTASFGVAKRAVSVTMNDDGSADVVYEINVENTGGVDLDSIQVTDDLAAAFPAPCVPTITALTSDDFQVNDAYDGVGDVELLSGNDDLPVGDKGAILLEINVADCGADNTGPFGNIAVGSADAPGDSMLVDTSTNGSDTDPDGDGDPTNNSDTTFIEFEPTIISLGTAKRVTRVIANLDGSYDITYEVNIENFGNVDLDSVQVTDDLTNTFPDPCQREVLEITSDDFGANPDFDGDADQNLLSGTDDLPVGDKGAVIFTVNVAGCADNGPFGNIVIGTAVGPGDSTVTDTSVSGEDSDPDGDGNPDETDTTFVELDFNPAFGVAKRVTSVDVQPNGSYLVTFELNVENTGNADLDSLQVTDDLSIVFPSPCEFVVWELTSDDYLVNNDYDGVADINLLTGGDDLPVGEKGAILLTINVDNCADDGPFTNIAVGSVTGAGDTMLVDTSQDGSDPDPDGDDDPTNNDDPTEFGFDCEHDVNCPEFVTTFPLDEVVECDAIPEPFVLIPEWHAVDNCTDPENLRDSFSSDTIDIICPNTYTIKRTWWITDEAGNTCFHIRKLYVQDTKPPTFEPVDDVTISCEESADTSNTGQPTMVMDNCGEIDTMVSDVSTQCMDPDECCFYTYTITRTFTYTDDCGNDTSHVQIIEVVDETLPDAVCADITIYLDEDGEALISANDLNDGSTDNCAAEDNLTLQASQTRFTCDDKGENLVILEVIDPCGNIGACVSTVTVLDTIFPQVECPKDWTFTLDPGQCEVIKHFEVEEIIENCFIDSFSITPNGVPFPIGDNLIEIYVEDCGGNVVECSFIFTVEEYPDPIESLSCNDRINISLNADCYAVIRPDMILEGGPYACYDCYEVTLIDQDGNELPSDTVFSDHVGEVLTVEVADICSGSGNLCWGEVLVESKLFPEFICPPDTSVVCNGQADIDFTGMPIITSCEGSVTIDYEDEVDDNGKCADDRVVITRTWTITDESGNQSTCVQLVTLLGFEVDQVEFPLNYDGIDNPAFTCAQVQANPSLTEPTRTGFITLNGVPVGTGEIPFCDLTYGYDDEILQGCGGSYEILRTWTIRNLCEPLEIGVNPIRHLQSILVWDMTPPEVIEPSDVTLSMAPDECGAYWNVPVPTVVGECSEFEYLVNVTGGNLIQVGAGAFILADIPEGETTVQYILQDACGNVGTHSITITVNDDQAPTAVCDENTVVSISVDGTAIIYAETFDDGSHDNCNDVWFKVIKEVELCGTPNGFDGIFNNCVTCEGLNAEGGDDDPNKTGVQVYFDDQVKYCCDEVGTIVPVVMRVFEKDPGEGPVDPARMEPGGDLWNTFNDCVVNSIIQDELPPIVICVPDITVHCEFEFDMEAIADPSDRTFGAMVQDGEVRQDVVVSGHGNPGLPDGYVWGIDGVYADNCSANIDVNVSVNIECGEGVVSRTFTVTDDFGKSASCTQRITFIEFDPFTEDNIDWPRDVELTDLCLSDVEDDPTATGEPDIVGDVCADIFVSYDDELFVNDADACFKILRTWKVLDWCQYDEATGAGVWTDVQVIKLSNEVAPELVIEDVTTVCDSAAAGCEGFIELVASATDDCSGEVTISYAIDAFDDGTIDISSTGSDASGVYPFGSHRIYWTAVDGCGNVTTADQPFVLEDCKKPSPKCFSGLVTVVMEVVGEVTIWASDFDAGSDDNCGDVTVSFSEDVNDWFRTFTCDDLGTQTVQIWVTDEAGNQDFCETFLFIQDNNDVCDGISGGIAGAVYTEQLENVENVDVELSSEGSLINTEVTDESGLYAFDGLPWYEDYEVGGFKNDDPRNGVSTFDIVKIQKHLLGLETFDSPYKYIAADVNNNQAVSAIDMVEIRRLLLGDYEEFPENTSWRFWVEDQVISDPSSPWPFEEIIEFENFDQETSTGNDFIAIKIGDITGDAETNSLLGTEDRTPDGALALSILDEKLSQGDQARVAVTAKDFRQMLGYQMTWNLEGLTVESIEAGALNITAANFSNRAADRGLMTMSWSEGEAVNVVDGEVLFTLLINVTETGYLSDMITLVDDITSVEAYSELSTDLDVVIDWRTQDNRLEFDWALEQNTPNPFDEETTIEFILAKASDVVLTVTDTKGQTVKTIDAEYGAGVHTIKIKRSELNAGGVYLYELDAQPLDGSEGFDATRKMIVVD